MLQDAVITVRGGRFCVPVKQEYKAQFSGMVHDQSSTGATVFMEPMSVVTLNNKIKELQAEESQEINRILYKLTAQVADNADTLYANAEILTKLDFIFAKGELSLSMYGTVPAFNTEGRINIAKGRHPLLSKDTVVPTNIYLGDMFNVLLITGPNTGGKTVALKTLGLFTLMGQSGLHIPAADGSELAVFDSVFADIGDEQSIEQSLSTFSGHMRNIVKILDDVTPFSLVLLDELGAGTDPTEGAALAVAIIERLREMGCRLAVTTHYSELKVYALSTEGVENAACEFDLETLRPTYKLLIGIPGKSNAFAISKKLGLSEGIIDKAKNVLSGADIRFEDVITDLEISRKSVELEQQKAEQYRLEAERIKAETEKQETRLKNQKDKIITDAKNEARLILEQAKKESDRIVKEMRKMLINTGNSSLAPAEELRRQLREMADGVSGERAAENQKPIDRPLLAGDKVFVRSLGQTGTVISDDDGNVTVQSGIMKVKVPVSDLSFDTETGSSTPKYGQKLVQQAFGGERRTAVSKSLVISPKIDLRGCLVEQALERVDKYIDDASLSGLAKIEIVHGKGTGALRSAIQAHLKTHPLIKTFRLGVFGEGEDGVTIAELK
jgi:DNA mismatch repair protein MutS2